MIDNSPGMSDKLKGKYKVYPVEKSAYKNSKKVNRHDDRGKDDGDSFRDIRETLEGKKDSVEIGHRDVPDPGTYSRDDITGAYDSILESDNEPLYTGPVGTSLDYGVSVKKESMPSGLFGWTRPGSGEVHISDNLYSADEKETINHEKTHLMFPGKDELTVRYINGDTDPENTVSSNYMASSRNENIYG